MGYITIVNKSVHDIQVKVAKQGGDKERDVSEGWYTLKANGGTDRWSRIENQLVWFVRAPGAGTFVETVLGVVDKTVEIP